MTSSDLNPLEKKRRNNIVIRGLPEGTHPDENLVNQVMTDIQCQDVEILSVQRLGRITNESDGGAAGGADAGAIPNVTGGAHGGATPTLNNSLNNSQSQEPQSNARRVVARPVRVVLQNPLVKDKVLKAAKNIRKSQSDKFEKNKVFIVPDQTALERRDDANLRQKLQKTRDENPGQDFIIRQRKIIPRPAGSGRPPQP